MQPIGPMHEEKILGFLKIFSSCIRPIGYLHVLGYSRCSINTGVQIYLFPVRLIMSLMQDLYSDFQKENRSFHFIVRQETNDVFTPDAH